jgi:hypothetical protein
MKNLKKLPTPIKFLFAMSYMLILSVAFAVAFNMEAIHEQASVMPALHYVGPIFLFIYAMQMLFGPIIARYKKAGMAMNDSLVINDTSYAGTVAPYFILPALFKFDTVVKKLVYLKDGIKKEHTIPTMDFSGPLQPRVAQPSQSGGNVTIDKRQLIPADMMAYQLMNPRNFEVHWDAEDLSQTLLTRQLPATAENYIMMLLLGRSFEQFEIMLWQGSVQYKDNANVPQFDPGGTPNPYYQIQFIDGYLKRMVSDSSIYSVPSPVTLTASNIVSAGLLPLYKLVAANNKGMLSNDPTRTKMKFAVSYNTAALYEEYLTTQPFKGNDPTERGLFKYLNWEVVPTAGVPDNTILFTEATSTPESNLWVGMNSISDENFMLAKHRPDSELFFFKMLMKMDVNYGRPEKIFLYTTLTAASFIQ